jgi:hypothetical protein
VTARRWPASPLPWATTPVRGVAAHDLRAVFSGRFEAKPVRVGEADRPCGQTAATRNKVTRLWSTRATKARDRQAGVSLEETDRQRAGGQVARLLRRPVVAHDLRTVFSARFEALVVRDDDADLP